MEDNTLNGLNTKEEFNKKNNLPNNGDNTILSENLNQNNNKNSSAKEGAESNENQSAKSNRDSEETNLNNQEMDSDVHVKTNEIEESTKEGQDDSNSAGSEKWFMEDREKFLKAYPDVNSEELFEDPIFLDFAEKRAGVDSMVDIYETYLRISRNIEAKVMEKAEKEFNTRLANAKASPGSLTENTGISDRLYTIEELKRMSPEAIERNWQKVQQSIKKYNK